MSFGQQADILFFFPSCYQNKQDEWGWEHGIQARPRLSQAAQCCDVIVIDVGMFAVLRYNHFNFLYLHKLKHFGRLFNL